MHQISTNRIHTIATDQLLVQDPAAGYDCGDCTACCTVLAVTELNKPMRRSCEHLCRDGCKVYSDRPTGCRQFNCLWLRGAVLLRSDSSDDRLVVDDGPCESLRPDHSGVIWDYFLEGVDQVPCLVAFEVWSDAFQRPDVLEFLIRVCTLEKLRLSFRNGDWAEVGNREELLSALNRTAE